MSKQTQSLLDNEISLLYDTEAKFKVPAAPVIRQLIAWAEQPLPDVLPRRPQMVRFRWPNDDISDYRGPKRWNPWNQT